MLNCPACGLTNRPYATACAVCGKPVQEAAAAEARRREWDALPARMREEHEQAFDRMREATDRHLEWLRRFRLIHGVLGAALINMVIGGSFGFRPQWWIPVDLFLSAAAAVLLNRHHGGSWHGAGYFLAATILSIALRAPFSKVATVMAGGGWILVSMAVMFVTVAGYYMGLRLSIEHTEHSVTG